MRRNVRNVTLVGFAALVLGGVAVAASGAFDSTPTDAVARESATGDAVAGAPTTMAAFSNDAKVESVAAGGAASGAATIAAGPAPAPAQDAATQVPGDDGAKIVKTADLTVSIAKGKFTGAFAEASRIATRERRVRRQLVDVHDGLPRQPHPARRHERAADAGL